jgi:PilZ domain
MRRFEYRHPRTTTGFRVDFVVGGETLHGLCRDISDAGIRAEFDDPVAVGSCGLLTLRHPTRLLKVEAQVAYIEKYQAGLSFLSQTPEQHAATMELIALITNHASTS